MIKYKSDSIMSSDWVQTENLQCEKCEKVVHKSNGEIVVCFKDGCEARFNDEATYEKAVKAGTVEELAHHAGNGDAAINCNPEHRFSEKTLKLLYECCGLGDSEVWQNIMTVISKSEHDNNDPKKWDTSDKGTSVFNYASCLSYDFKERGCTLGLVGFTTHNAGKQEYGDAQPLFKAYAKAGGRDDLAKLSEGIPKDKSKGEKLAKVIEKLDDETWRDCQWAELTKSSPSPGGYLYYTMKMLNKRGLTKPKALTICMIFDHTLNCGASGPHCVEKIFSKIDASIKGSDKEKKLIEEFTKLRKPILGDPKFDYNGTKTNGENRGQQIVDLMNKGHMDLKNCTADLKAVLSWKMK